MKQQIGGLVDRGWIKNTCAIRMSRSLNAGGHDIPRSFPGLNTIRGGDGKRYAYRVAELRKYFVHRYGDPDIKHANPGNGGPVPPSFQGVKGVLMLDVRTWSDATGHWTIWDGSKCRDTHVPKTNECYFGLAREVWLWKAPLNASTTMLQSGAAYRLALSTSGPMKIERNA